MNARLLRRVLLLNSVDIASLIWRDLGLVNWRSLLLGHGRRSLNLVVKIRHLHARSLMSDRHVHLLETRLSLILDRHIHVLKARSLMLNRHIHLLETLLNLTHEGLVHLLEIFEIRFRHRLSLSHLLELSLFGLLLPNDVKDWVSGAAE